jgi:DNA-binding transcriptional ArsR family regulator
MASKAAGLPDNHILDTLRELQADDDRNELVLPAFTLKALAEATGVSIRALPLALARLLTAGKITTRTVKRSGETLYKLADQHHAAWQSQKSNF